MDAKAVLELFIITVTVFSLLFFYKGKKVLLKRYFLIAAGVFLFEFSTQLLWINKGLHPLTYLGPTLNWIITLGWTNIIFYSMLVVDMYVKKSQIKRYFASLILIVIVSLIAENIVLLIGIRAYSNEVTALLSGVSVPFLSVPIEALFYIPAFIALVLGFTKYFESSEKGSAKWKKSAKS